MAIWQILSQDSTLTTGLINQMLDMLQRQLPYEEKTDGDKMTKLATKQPLAVCKLVDFKSSLELVLHVCYISTLIKTLN